MRLPSINLSIVVGALLLTGCASEWIDNPSPSTRNLVNDLRLEGYDCKARMSDIECTQIEPMRNKQLSKCDSTKGCVKQPDVLIYNRYRIDQPANGIPTLKHDIVQKIEGKRIGGTTVTPN